jgi:spore germination cell wall hydrolase CwlJ-like protein
MTFIFYLIHLLTPDALSTSSQKASVESLETFYGQLNTRVASQSEMAYRMDVECLTRIVFNESRNEPIAGKQMVAQVTVNRAASGKFPDTICKNMKAKGAYSFYNPESKHVDKARKYPVEYKHIAEKALNGEYKHLISSKTLYFKNCKVQSSFFDKLVMVKRVGQHCFFSEPKHLVANN